ncbi:Tautomerase/MIF [Linderina pennispora]|uniref:L-dopachrome isomerase n=1 Tax=Linderina pennispora TaxID=61395 RepID=A0A1Y1VXV8_9FUNG|nr:Tautomerase/MIF [Linderina pennispora]ORX66109.1 Tautomerase/MIF [Linderina pennispora]
MPVVDIITNSQEVDAKSLSVKASTYIAQMLDIPIDMGLTTISRNPSMCFGGTHEPTTFVNFVYCRTSKSPEQSTIVGKFTEFICSELGVNSKRVFMNLVQVDPEAFGWDGETLALSFPRNYGLYFPL